MNVYQIPAPSGGLTILLTPEEAHEIHRALTVFTTLFTLSDDEDIIAAIELRQLLAQKAPAYGGPIKESPG